MNKRFPIVGAELDGGPGVTSRAPSSSDRVTARKWVALLGAMLGAFMAVLDIQITNASLNDILGSLGSTLDEGSWVSTSYLVAEIIVIPLTGWLSEVFSDRRYLLANAIAFLLASVACAWSWNLSSLIVFRIVQGFSGGVLIPAAFNLVLKTLPPGQHALGFALFGMTATFAPAIGPTLGGWLTTQFGWPSIFYLNLIPGALLVAGVGWGLPVQPARLSLLQRGDWPGIFTAALGLGALMIFLEEGNRYDWFSSGFISTMALLAVLSLLACVFVESRAAYPFVDFRLLARRNFGLGCLVGTAFGAGMYGATFLLPLYLAQVQGYNAQQIGQTMVWSGLPQVFIMPLVVLLLRRIEARWLITLGLGLFAASGFLNSSITNLSGEAQLRASQLVRAMGMPMVIVPITTLATGGLEASQSGSASGLFNMFRNLGGSIGIALLATQLDVREKFHSLRLCEQVSLFNPMTAERVSSLSHQLFGRGVDASGALQKAVGAIAATLRREALVMAYADCFLVLGSILLISVGLVWACRPAKGGALAAH